jgi:hypothetical protein
MAHYPPITESMLTPFRALEVQLQQEGGADLLDREECPYPSNIKPMLRRLAGGELVATGTEMMTDAASDRLDVEIANIFETVKRDMNMYTGSDMKDKMSFLKTGQDLLSKIVDLQAKRFNIRNSARTQRAVVDAMEEFLTPAQRTSFIERLEGFVDVS